MCVMRQPRKICAFPGLYAEHRALSDSLTSRWSDGLGHHSLELSSEFISPVLAAYVQRGAIHRRLVFMDHPINP
eukprot:4006320-Pyramimonas_sp.AAC.1